MRIRMGLGIPSSSRALGPYLSSFDFTGMAGGFVASPNGLIYQCASSARTVQTGDDVVVEGGGVDAVPIGRSLSSNEFGIALDGPCVNAIPGQIGGSGWTNSAIVAPETGPGGGSCFSIEDDSPGLHEISARSIITGTGAHAFSIWVKGMSIAADPYFILVAHGAIFTHPSIPLTWQRYAAFPTFAAPQTAATWYTRGSALNVGKQAVYNPILQSGSVPSDYYNGTRLGAALGVGQNLAVSGGRIGLEAEFYPRAKYTEHPERRIWHLDANNYATMTSTATSVVIGGVAWTVAAPIVWPDPVYTSSVLTSQPKVQIWVEAGGGSLQSVIKYRVNGGAVTTLGTSPAPQTAISGAGNVSVLSNLSDKTQFQMAGHLTRFKFAKSGKRPSWA